MNKAAEYNSGMAEFKFSKQIDVRYGDLDPQWHVNNVHFLIFLEHTRLNYLMNLNLFDGKSFFDLGLIVADIHISYLAPITLKQNIKVWMRTERIGNKSLVFVYEIRDEDTQEILAKAETIMVTYDYHAQKSIPVPDRWREAISQFEGLDFSRKE